LKKHGRGEVLKRITIQLITILSLAVIVVGYVVPVFAQSGLDISQILLQLIAENYEHTHIG